MVEMDTSPPDVTNDRNAAHAHMQHLIDEGPASGIDDSFTIAALQEELDQQSCSSRRLTPG